MDRLACVDLPDLPLQLLLRREPAWRALPTVVLDREAPQGMVLFASSRARAAGVGPGWRHAAALGVCPQLRARSVPSREVDVAIAELCELFRRFSPHVEPGEERPGAFWLDARGLNRIQPSLHVWAESIRAELKKRSLAGAVAVGWSRFSTEAVARALRARRSMVFDSLDQERNAAARVDLAELGLPEAARSALADLAVHTVGDLARLPGAGLRKRFGTMVHSLHRQARGELLAPVQPRAPEEPLAARLDLDDAEDDRERLTFLIKQLLDGLLARLERRASAIAGLTLVLGLGKGRTLREQIRPAAPSLDGVQLLGLVKLRLESLALEGGAKSVELEVRAVPATAAQLALFAQKPRRDLEAAARAFARLRASYGDAAVVKPVLTSGHLPEARFAWEPLSELPVAQPRTPKTPRLIRSLRARVESLPKRPEREPDGWLIRGFLHGPVARSWGPHRIHGGWWRREIHRDYFTTELQNGELYWVYRDANRRWFLHAEIS